MESAPAKPCPTCPIGVVKMRLVLLAMTAAFAMSRVLQSVCSPKRKMFWGVWKGTGGTIPPPLSMMRGMPGAPYIDMRFSEE